MDYEAFKSAAMEELKSAAPGKPEPQQAAKPAKPERAEKTSSLSLICAMLIAATIGFYSTRIDLNKLSSQASGKHEVMDSMLALVGLHPEKDGSQEAHPQPGDE
jgi:hypothetical protein